MEFKNTFYGKLLKYLGVLLLFFFVSILLYWYCICVLDLGIAIEASQLIKSRSDFVDEGKFIEMYKPGFDKHIYKNYEIYSIIQEAPGLRSGKFFWFFEIAFYKLQYLLLGIRSKFAYYFFLEINKGISFDKFLELKGRRDLINKGLLSWIVEKVYSFDIYFAVSNPPMFSLENNGGYFYKQIIRSYMDSVRSPFGDLFFLSGNKGIEGKLFFYEFWVVLLTASGFLFYLSMYTISFFILFYYFLFYLYQTKIHSFISWLDLYVSEDDDFMMGYFEIMLIQGEFEKYEDYYNITKFEHIFLLNIVFLDQEVGKWISFLRYTGKENFEQFFQLGMNINLLLVTKVDMISWLIESGSEEGNDWAFYPYEILPTIFFEYDLYLKNYEDNQITEADIGYSMFDYYLADTLGVSKYEIYRHPLEDVRNVGESTTEYFYNDVHFKPDVFFKGSKHDPLILDRFVERYIKIHEISLEKNLSVEASVEYFGVFNNEEESAMRSTDSGLNAYFHEFKLFEGYLSATTVPFRPFPEHIMEKLLKREDFRDLLKKFPEYIANPKDKRFKMVPRIWKEMNFTNFMFSVVNLSLLHFLIRSNVFWRDIADMAELEEGGVNYYEERHQFFEDLRLSGIFEKFENSLPAMYGFGLGRRSHKNKTINLGTMVVFEKLDEENRDYNICKYPPYLSNIGANLVPAEYRVLKGQDFFYLRYILFGKAEINSFDVHKLNFMKNCIFDRSLDTTYYVGPSNLPEGYPFLTTLDSSDNMYKGVNIKLEKSAYAFEEKDKSNELDYENLEDGVEIIFFSVIFPTLLIVNFVLNLFF
jgi:hypothetical protein